MEDFAPLWILVVIGAMAYSAITQAQKQKQKGKNPNPEHGEAWPSWPKWDAEPETEAQEAERPFAEQPFDEKQVTERPFAAPVSPFEDGQDAEPAYEDESRYEKPHTPARSTATSLNVAKYTANSRQSASTTAPTAFTSLTSVAQDPGVAEEHHETTQDGQTGDLTADFDLRRAVIYSEILKPKFDE